ncbi:hypothetical protein ACLI4Z_03130 [Natrialbaceae archaeon A-arb3/5]
MTPRLTQEDRIRAANEAVEQVTATLESRANAADRDRRVTAGNRSN